jgi:hypothetical protein
MRTMNFNAARQAANGRRFLKVRNPFFAPMNGNPAGRARELKAADSSNPRARFLTAADAEGMVSSRNLGILRAGCLLTLPGGKATIQRVRLGNSSRYQVIGQEAVRKVRASNRKRSDRVKPELLAETNAD